MKKSAKCKPVKSSMTNAEIYQRVTGLQKLRELNNAVPAIVGYRIAQNLHALETALVPYNETRDQIIIKHSKDGKSVDGESDREAFLACTKDLSELEQISVDVEIWKIPFSSLDGREFPVGVILALDFMLEDSEG